MTIYAGQTIRLHYSVLDEDPSSDFTPEDIDAASFRVRCARRDVDDTLSIESGDVTLVDDVLVADYTVEVPGSWKVTAKASQGSGAEMKQSVDVYEFEVSSADG